jgi:MiaB-like tRNA modifying enzyme
MKVHRLINFVQTMLQFPVNSSLKKPLCFYFLLNHLTYCDGEKMRVFLKSYGCSANQADSEVLLGCLTNAGYKSVGSPTEADVVVINTCAVKGPTENRVVEALKRIPKGKKLVVAGCLPLTSFERLSQNVRFDGLVGPAFGKEIVSVVDRVMNGERVISLDFALQAKPSLLLPRLRSNYTISVIPTNYGCLGSCVYCCVVFARGRLRSYTHEEIVERLRDDVKAGAKEFWLTSQDIGCYGRDFGSNLADLLEALVVVEGDFRIRVGMMTPNMVGDIAEDLALVFKSEKVFKFLHLPVQSGDDRVLEGMHRRYTVQEFIDIVDVFRTTFPKLTLSTDVICGFPGETEGAFEHTLGLIEKVKPDIVNISKFFPRPKTAAAMMKNEFVGLTEIRRRSTAVAQLIKRISFVRNQQWLGWNGEVLVDEIGKVSGTWIGRNFAYKPVTVKSEKNLLGQKVTVRVVKAFSTYLAGMVD